ncbi:MAG: polysaccharide deacetylase family protein [Acidimicrobiia bacterium]|nr:polysaccharide deacetylase family protein [Acidimicrobiia bacterium]
MNASLSLDLDNLWSYLKTHGDAAWVDYPSYLDLVVPHILELAANSSTTISVFVVGQDAAFEQNRELLSSLSAAGHEIGNHSFRHEPWINTYSDGEVADELKAAHDAIATATGFEPTGFRGPGFSVSAAVLRTLAGMGYSYDASTLPTWIGPLARRYYFRSTSLSSAEAEKRSALFGSARDALLPNSPYEWDLGTGRLAEIPVTTMPLARVPIHVSYLLYLSRISAAVAESYLRIALWLCDRRGVGPSILLHPLDLLGGDEVQALEFFPGMDMPGSLKRERTARYVELLSSRYRVGTMAYHLASVTPISARRRP